MISISKELLQWYSVNKRTLPWRDIGNPYFIWLSEIILQQTRIVQGLEYYLRFVKAFPTVVDLANATEDDVLKLWQGLGYYSRARNLHAAAKSMNGVFPSTYDGVRALKGVGDYTAAAICSMAYQMPYAVVDGNVYRVLSRVFAINTPIDSTEGKKEFSKLAQQLLDKQFPGDYNQAIMDFGAMQCTPQTPNCAICPLKGKCKAYKQGETDTYPVKSKQVKLTTRYFHYILVGQNDFVWLRKRDEQDIWKNLYEPYLIEWKDNSLDWMRAKEYKAVLNNSKCKPVKKQLKHVLSHQIIYADLYEITLPKSVIPPTPYFLINKKDLHKYAVSRLVQKLLDSII